MEVIQDVGSYAGFAAVVGLAVLAALIFSQARDVRRLREWAGRAPERAAEQAAQQAVAPEQAAREAARPAASGAVRPIPAVKPATPGQPATAAKPATATPAGDKAAGDKPAEKPGAAPPVPATATANAGQATAAGPAPATPAGAPAQGKPPTPPKAPDGPPPTPAAGGPAPANPPARPTPVLPARPAPPLRSPAAATASQSTAVLPASSARLRDRPRRGGGERAGLAPRYIALVVAGVIVIGGAAAFGISQLGGDDDTGAPGDSAGDQPQAPVNPSTVTVSVLNGTTVPGLAAQIGDEIESAGFQRGNVANALDQQRTTSVVLFAEGADREARLVARRLGVAEVEPIDPDSQALGGNASVVVIVGADQTQ